MSYDNGLTVSGSDVYINEGRESFYTGQDGPGPDGNVSPYAHHGCHDKSWKDGGPGWKGHDWIAGYKDAQEKCTPKQRAQRFKVREIILKDRVREANERLEMSQRILSKALAEWEDHNIENT